MVDISEYDVTALEHAFNHTFSCVVESLQSPQKSKGKGISCISKDCCCDAMLLRFGCWWIHPQILAGGRNIMCMLKHHHNHQCTSCWFDEYRRIHQRGLEPLISMKRWEKLLPKDQRPLQPTTCYTKKIDMICLIPYRMDSWHRWFLSVRVLSLWLISWYTPVHL